MIKKLHNFINNPIFTIIGGIAIFFFIMCGYVKVVQKIAKDTAIEQFDEIYNDAYEQGFSRGLQNKIIDDDELPYYCNDSII